MIHIIDSARFKVDRLFVKKVAHEHLARLGFDGKKSLNIIFVGKRKMLYIATVYKREPEALPVLSFSYVTTKKMIKEATIIDGDALHANLAHASLPSAIAEDDLLGEIFICYPQAVLLAAERNKKVNDMLTYLIEHGINNLAK
ncbi:MAG TPA: rRNA maturation RNAse YbeY [Candidatus Woesebacteria bacterium]|nr:rRNA maturation RNAse YbeY [Candidatus Woesebacteria bacterium]HNS94412.1 rRNA maturation RNAse YbeY [Candidatus Woesebacteria bacterium]